MQKAGIVEDASAGERVGPAVFLLPSHACAQAVELLGHFWAHASRRCVTPPPTATPDPEPVEELVTPAAAAAAAANGGFAGRSPEETKKAVEELKKNPEMLKNMGEARGRESEPPSPSALRPGSATFGIPPPAFARAAALLHPSQSPTRLPAPFRSAQMMGNMSEEQLKMLSQNRIPGMPEVTPEMAKQAAEMMKKMSPEDMSRMMEMAEKMGPLAGAAGAGGERAASGAAASSGAGGMPQMTPEMMAQMGETMKDPKMMEARPGTRNPENAPPRLANLHPSCAQITASPQGLTRALATAAAAAAPARRWCRR